MALTTEELVDELRAKRDAMTQAINALTGEAEGHTQAYRVTPTTGSRPARTFDQAKSNERSQKMREAWAKRREKEAQMAAAATQTAEVQAPPQAEVVQEVHPIPVEQPTVHNVAEAPRPATTKKRAH